MVKASQTPNPEKTLEQYYNGSVYEFTWTKSKPIWANSRQKTEAQKTFRVSEEFKSSWRWQPREAPQRTPQIQWWHLKIMTFTNPEESWNSKTVIYGCVQQIYRGTFPSSWPFVRNFSRTIVQEHPKNGRPSSRRPRSRRSRKMMMDEVMPTGKHHLGHGTNLWPGHLHLGNTGVRTKRASILIGKHHLNGAAQIQRVNDPNGDHQVPGSHHEEWVPHLYRHFARAFMTTKIKSVCDGRPSFRHFCHLSFVVFFWCERLS